MCSIITRQERCARCGHRLGDPWRASKKCQEAVDKRGDLGCCGFLTHLPTITEYGLCEACDEFERRVMRNL